RFFRLSSVIQSAVSVSLRRNISVRAVPFNKELDSTSGGPTDAGTECQGELDRELFKLKQMFGKADMNMFPNFTFENTLVIANTLFQQHKRRKTLHMDITRWSILKSD
ncbi:hypothetical protein FD754_003938, partial [Muntiacus muntjak]